MPGLESKGCAPPVSPVVKQVKTLNLETDESLSVPNEWTDIPEMAITLTTEASTLLIVASFSATAAYEASYAIVVDGVQKRGARETHAGTEDHSGCIVHTQSINAGSHTVKLQWMVGGATLSCLASTSPEIHHVGLTVIEY